MARTVTTMFYSKVHCARRINKDLQSKPHSKIRTSRVKKYARMDNFWRKKDRKFNENVSVRDLLQLLITEEGLWPKRFYLIFYLFYVRGCPSLHFFLLSLLLSTSLSFSLPLSPSLSLSLYLSPSLSTYIYIYIYIYIHTCIYNMICIYISTPMAHGLWQV